MGDLGKLPGGGDPTLGLPLLTFPFLFSQKCTEAPPSRCPVPLGFSLAPPSWRDMGPAAGSPGPCSFPAGKPLSNWASGASPAPRLSRECRASRRGCCEEEGVSEGDSGRPGVPTLSLPWHVRLGLLQTD